MQHRAFTTRYNGRARVLSNKVNVCLPIPAEEAKPPKEVQLIPDDNVLDDQQPQLLIGMDIIGLGDFAVTNANDKTTFSFRIPSVREIDFIPEAQESNIMEGGNRQARRAFQARKRRGLIS